MIDKLPPHSEEAEKGVLGCVMLSATECLDECQSAFKAGSDVFYLKQHSRLYEVMLELRAEQKPIDTISLHNRLAASNELNSCGGLSYISELPDSVPSAANVGYYIEIVLDKYRLRRAVAICTLAVRTAYGDCDVSSFLGCLENEIAAIDEGSDDKPLDGKAVARAMIDDLERRHQLQGKPSGLTTGFYKLDGFTDGFQFGEQVVLAARPSVGKTAISLNFLERICLINGTPSLFVTLEMSPASLAKRLLASGSKISMNMLRTGKFAESEFALATSFSVSLSKARIHIIDGVSGMDANQVCAQIRRLVRQHGIRFVVIDYLQKIHAPTRHEKRTYEVAQVSGMIRALAQELNIAIVTLAQLNRESEKDKGRFPRLSDLADSGQIERDADVVLLLHRERDKPTDAKLIVGKQRDGEIGVCDLYFNGKYCRFENATYQQAPNEN